MSIKVMAHVWEHATVAGSYLLTLLAIADWTRDDGTNAYPTIAMLAVKTRLSTRSIQRIIQELEQAGEITIQRSTGRGHANVYSIPLKGVRLSPVKDDVNIKGDTNEERVTNDTVKGDTPRDTNRHTQPLEQPSLLSSKLPEWFETLSEDPRWKGDGPERYIATVEKAHPGVNLDLEAHAALEWLKTPEGLKKKVLRGFWTNWLKNAASRPTPPRDRNDLPTAAEMKAHLGQNT